MLVVHHGQRTMSKEVGYHDWDKVVQETEANLEVLDGNKRRAEVGRMREKASLEFALKKRDKYPKPVEEKSEVPKGVN